jgi:hypothetical protein
MTDDDVRRPGHGPLTFTLIVGHAWGMLRLGFGRVAFVALILFMPPAILGAFLQGVVEAEAEGVPGAALLALGIAVVFRLFGPVVFAGYLDEAVGTEYFEGRRIGFPDVLRTLPWLKLLAADLVVVIGTSLGVALLIVPGLIFYAFFGLVGPVIVQERRGLRDAFGRTFRISRPAIVPIIGLVVVPVALEQLVHEVAHRAVDRGAVAAELVVEWLVAAVVGGIVGLLEVALATELMARDPE